MKLIVGIDPKGVLKNIVKLPPLKPNYQFVWVDNIEDVYKVSKVKHMPIYAVLSSKDVFEKESLQLSGFKKIIVVPSGQSVADWLEVAKNNLMLGVIEEPTASKDLLTLLANQECRLPHLRRIIWVGFTEELTDMLTLLKTRVAVFSEFIVADTLDDVDFMHPLGIHMLILNESVLKLNTQMIKIMRQHPDLEKTLIGLAYEKKPEGEMLKDVDFSLNLKEVSGLEVADQVQEILKMKGRLLQHIDTDLDVVSYEKHQDRIEAELMRCLRYGIPVGFALIRLKDTQGLEKIYGLGVMSLLLDRVVKIGRKRLRKTDQIFQTINDELVFLLPQANEVEAGIVLNNLKQQVLAELKKTVFLKKIRIVGGISFFPECSDMFMLESVARKRVESAELTQDNFIQNKD